MKTTAWLSGCILTLFVVRAAGASAPVVPIDVDLKAEREGFTFECFQAEDTTIRATFYNGGVAWTGDTNYTAILGFGTSYDAAQMVLTTNTFTGAVSYLDFRFTPSQLNTNGIFYGQLMVTNTSGQRWVFDDGRVVIKKSPISGGATAQVFLSIVNWDVVTNTGTLPWLNSDTLSTVLGRGNNAGDQSITNVNSIVSGGALTIQGYPGASQITGTGYLMLTAGSDDLLLTSGQMQGSGTIITGFVQSGTFTTNVPTAGQVAKYNAVDARWYAANDSDAAGTNAVVGFSAYRTYIQTNASVDVTYTGQFPTETYDSNNAFTNNEYTIPISGNWMFTANDFKVGGSAGDRIAFVIEVVSGGTSNFVAQQYSMQVGNVDALGESCSAVSGVLPLATNDVVRVRQNSGGTATWGFTTAPRTINFSGYLLDTRYGQ